MRICAAHLLSLLPLALALADPAPQDEIARRQAELEAIREQVRGLDENIRQQQQSEATVLELLDTYDRKATLLRRLIAKLRVQEQQLQARIDASGRTLHRLEQQYAFLRSTYAGYVTAAYKSGRVHDLELLLSSTSLHQAYVRNEYLKRFTAQRRADAARLQAARIEVGDAQARAQQQLSEERRLIAEKGAEEDRLASLAADRREVLDRIRKDRKIMLREMDRQMKAAQEMEQFIAQLIEAERLRKERQAEEARRGKPPEPPPAVTNFGQKKGRLRWPVSRGAVVARFGNQRHPTLRTITRNTGIDIAVPPGSPVASVADGEAARIWWLPSFGNLLMVNHYDGERTYRTVYAHLAEILVVEGQKLREGDIIAESGEAVDGARLHFELWKDRDIQNPEEWLVRQ